MRLRVDGMTSENNFKNSHVNGKHLMCFHTKTYTCGRGIKKERMNQQVGW